MNRLRKYVSVILMLLNAIIGYGQVGFFTHYGETIDDRAEFRDVLIDNDTIVLYMASYDTVYQTFGIRFLKLDSLGNVLTSNQVTDSTVILTTLRGEKKIIKTSDGGYAIAGATWTVPGVMFLMKLHHDLSLDFVKMLPNYNDNSGNVSLLELPTGYMVLAQNSIGNDRDIIVLKTDKMGNEKWRRNFYAPDEIEYPRSLQAINNNRFIISGGRANIPASFSVQSTYVKRYALAIDSLGTKVWDWAGQHNDSLGAIIDFEILPDSSWVCISGTWEYSAQYGNYSSRLLIFKMDKDYNLIWKKVFGKLSGAPHAFQNLVHTPDNNFLATGTMYDEESVSIKAIHYKFTAAGDSLWMRLDSSYVDDGGLSVPKTRVIGTALLSSGSIISIGYADSLTSQGVAPFGFVMKLSPDGCMDTLNCWPVSSMGSAVKLSKKLLVYPNPASDVVYFKSKSNWPIGQSTIIISNVLGQDVNWIFFSGGDAEWDLSNIHTGIYYYRVVVQNEIVDVGKIIVN